MLVPRCSPRAGPGSGVLVPEAGGAVCGETGPGGCGKDRQSHPEVQDEPLHTLHPGARPCSLGPQQVGPAVSLQSTSLNTS